MKKIIIVIFSGVIFFSCKKGVDASTAEENHGTPAVDSITHVLPAELKQGINVSNWFEDISKPSQYSNAFTPQHFIEIKKLGFTYVRIPIGRTVLFQPSNP